MRGLSLPSRNSVHGEYASTLVPVPLLKGYVSVSWSLVASVVQTRNSDREHSLYRLLDTVLMTCPEECAKRWTDTLNPAIDRTNWSPEAVCDNRYFRPRDD